MMGVSLPPKPGSVKVPLYYNTFPISRQWRPVIKAASRDVNLACPGCGQVGIIDVKVLSARVGQASGLTYSARPLLRSSRPLLWFFALDNLAFFNPRIAMVIRTRPIRC